MKTALIIGVLSQDGRYMSSFLLNMGYKVYGTVREGDPRISNLHFHFPQMQFFPSNIENSSSLESILKIVRPDEIYNFSGLSSVAKSFDMPAEYDLVNYKAVVSMLKIIEKFDKGGTTKFFQSGSSEMFGASELIEVDELSNMNPNSPYAVSKFKAFEAVRHFRESTGIFAVNGILFNHESEYRKPEFLSRKIINFLVSSKYLGHRQITLGNTTASRDWSYVGDFVPGIWKSLQVEIPSEYIFASGVQKTVLQFLELGCSILEINFNFERDLLIDTSLYRNSESVPVKAITLKANRELGWKSSYTLEQLISRLLFFETIRVRDGIEPPIFPDGTV